MLVDIVLSPIMYIFNWFSWKFPTIGLDSSMLANLVKFFDFISSVNRYIPVNELFQCVVILVVAYNINLVMFVANWLFNKILDIIPF